MTRFARAAGHVVLAVACAQVSMSAAAQTAFPTKPIRMLVGFPPGGFTDLAGRMLAQEPTA